MDTGHNRVSMLQPLPREEAAALLHAASVAAAPVLEIHESLGCDTLLRRGLLQWMPTADGESIPALAAPYRWHAGVPATGRPVGAPGSDDALLGRTAG